MRPFLAVVIAVVLLGSVALYTALVRTLPDLPPAGDQLTRAPGQFSLELTLTFDAQENSFTVEPTSLLVTFEDRVVLHTADTIRAGVPITVDVANVKVGKNEFYIEANTPDVTIDDGRSVRAAAFPPEAAGRSAEPAVAAVRAVRVRVLRDGVVIGEKTLWSEPGQSVRGAVLVEVRAQPDGPR